MRPSIKAEGAFYSASERGAISHVDIRDVAAVAVRALTEPGHEGKAYTLTGPEALTLRRHGRRAVERFRAPDPSHQPAPR